MNNFFYRKLKIGLVLLFLMCFAGLFTVTAQSVCNNGVGSQGGYTYEYWKDNGTGCMTLGSGGAFGIEWNNINNLLARKGLRPGSKQQVVQYAANYQPNGNSYLCVYGWTTNPLIEYYIVDSWGTWRPPGGQGFVGTVTSDGDTYDIYKTQRVNQPSIEGPATFYQFWSVRRTKRSSGTITCANHFNAWQSNGMTMGSLYEVSFCVEGYQSSGTADVYSMSMSTGGVTTPQPPATPTPVATPTPTPPSNSNIVVRAMGTLAGGILECRVNGALAATWTLSTTMQNYYAKGSGGIELYFTNDDGSDSGLDLQVDYLQYNGTTYQAEDQAVNTAVWNSEASSCGGSYSEMMHCEGYIRFNTSPVVTTPTPTPVTTPILDGRGLVSFKASTYSVKAGAPLNMDVVVNTGTQKLAAYGITVSYNANYLSLDTSLGSNGITAGAQGFLAAVNSSSGSVTISGFDATGTGPGSSLHLVTVHFTGKNEGNSTVSIQTTDLVDSNYAIIGNPRGGSAAVTVGGTANKGDVNGDGEINIVDALMTAQYSVGLAPQPFDTQAADVNCDGTINILDALMIAQRYIGLLTAFPC